MTIEQSGPSAADVRQALSRLRLQEGFVNPKNGEPTNRFLVLQELVNQALTEPPPQFVDRKRVMSVVWADVSAEDRVQQSIDDRLRQTILEAKKHLRDYYSSGDSAGDPVNIELRKSPYLPRFSWRPGPASIEEDSQKPNDLLERSDKVKPRAPEHPSDPAKPPDLVEPPPHSWLWLVIGLVAIVLIVSAIGTAAVVWRDWDTSRCGEGVRVTSLSSEAAVAPINEVSGERTPARFSRCSDYLLVETVNPPLGRWIQAPLIGREQWRTTSIFGQDDTPDGTRYRVSVVSTTQSLQPGMLREVPEGARVSSSVLVVLRKENPAGASDAPSRAPSNAVAPR